MGSVEKVRFVHLSDIHFNKKAATFGFDPDRELRRLVQRDIAEQRLQLGPANAVLVSGDIAYAGKREEFEDAARLRISVKVISGFGERDQGRKVVLRGQEIVA